jgi:hypothetical protein
MLTTNPSCRPSFAFRADIERDDTLRRHLRILSRASTTAGILLIAAGVAVAGTPQPPTISALAPANWQAADSEFGLQGCVRVEDFEDSALVTGLQVQLSGGTADFGPTSNLPHAFDPVADDPNAGDVLAPGIWDGSRVLLNRQNAPIRAGYVDGEWADITFVIAGGASFLGFSAQQLEVAGTMLTVTTVGGSTSVDLATIANFSVGGGRNG